MSTEKARQTWASLCALQRWQGCDCHPGGFEKLLCSDIVKEFKCEAASILSSNMTVERWWTETTGLHLAAQDGLEHDVHTQQGQAVQYLGSSSSVRNDIRR